MIIAVDGNEANVQNRVGVNQYAFEILKGLRRLSDKTPYKHEFIVYLKNPPLSDLPSPSRYFSYRLLPPSSFWIATKLMPALFRDKPRADVFFSPSHYLPPFVPMPRVCSIMDLGYLEFTGQFKKMDFWQLKYWTAISICVSKAVIAISNSTKRDIVRHYPSALKKVHVTLLAHDKERFNTDIPPKDVRRILKRHSIVNDYILFISTLKPSKNVEGLLEAFSRVKYSLSRDNPEKSTPRLVIAGKKGWMFEEIFEKVKSLGLEDDVIFTGFVSEEDKPYLIAGARMLVLPSFWEGFGFDPLNAMACGVPVVVSDAGSLPEVAGKAGVFVDPKSPKSIADGILGVLSMSPLEYNNLKRKAILQAGKFSWERTVSGTLGVLEKAAEK